MKKKLISMMIVTMMAVTLFGCGAKEEEEAVVSNSVINNVTTTKDEDSKESKANEIAKDEAIKIHEENITRLKAFYDNNKIPYEVSNMYNTLVDEGKLVFGQTEIEAQKIDVGNLDYASYDFSEDYIISATIDLKWDDNLNLNNSLAEEYTKAIVGEKVDFTDVMKEVKEFVKRYQENPQTESLIYDIETDKYLVSIGMVTTETIGVSISSTFEVK